MSALMWAGTAALVTGAVLLCLPRATSSGSSAPRTRSSVGELLQRMRSRDTMKPAALRQDSAELLRQFSALLRSGRGEGQAWADLWAHWRGRDPDHPLTLVCGQAAAAEASGSGTAEGLRRAVLQTPSAQLRRLINRLIAVTALSEQTGAALSHLVEQLAGAVDDSAQLAAAVETAVAGPKLTQLVLTLLPAAGVGLGHMMGAAPLQTLLGGGLGMLCLLGGIGFLLLGRFWSARMIAAVVRRV